MSEEKFIEDLILSLDDDSDSWSIVDRNDTITHFSNGKMIVSLTRFATSTQVIETVDIFDKKDKKHLLCLSKKISRKLLPYLDHIIREHKAKEIVEARSKRELAVEHLKGLL